MPASPRDQMGSPTLPIPCTKPHPVTTPVISKTTTPPPATTSPSSKQVVSHATKLYSNLDYTAEPQGNPSPSSCVCEPAHLCAHCRTVFTSHGAYAILPVNSLQNGTNPPQREKSTSGVVESPSLPQSLREISSNERRNPRNYRGLPSELTKYIQPAGKVSFSSRYPRTTVNDCLRIYE